MPSCAKAALVEASSALHLAQPLPSILTEEPSDAAVSSFAVFPGAQFVHPSGHVEAAGCSFFFPNSAI